MSGIDNKLRQSFNALVQPKAHNFLATVKSVDKKEKTIVVVDLDDFELDEVRLTSVIDKSNSVVRFPKIGSTVLVAPVNNDDHTFFVIAISEVESLQGTIETTDFLIDKEGYQINREGENLKIVLNDYIAEFGKLCDELAKVVVSIGVTPNVPVITAIKKEVTQQIKARLNNILK